MSLQLYCWIVGDLYDSKHVTVVAENVEAARAFINSRDTIEVSGDHDLNLNWVCDYGDHRGYTWKQIINYEDPNIYDIVPGAIFAFQYGTG